ESTTGANSTGAAKAAQWNAGAGSGTSVSNNQSAFWNGVNAANRVGNAVTGAIVDIDKSVINFAASGYNRFFNNGNSLNEDVCTIDITHTSLSIGGVGSGIGEYSNVYNGSWKGLNDKWYDLNWGGNQYTGGRSIAIGKAELFSTIGTFGFYADAGTQVVT